MRAANHPLQQDRLAALNGYAILDTEPEAEFDEITNFVAKACDVPISVINFIDAERQWFKSETGLGVRSTPIDTSICAHIILEEDFVEIEDTLRDPRLADNPLCIDDDGLRFYAGALLKTEDGLPIGTLCILDRRPRKLTEFQKELIQVMSHQVMARLNLRRSLDQATILRQEVDHRVKNSLQSVASIASIKSRLATDPAVSAALADIRDRIDSVARLHTQLYKLDNDGRVDVSKIMKAVADEVAAVVEDVAVEFDGPSVFIEGKPAAALGTLLNELTSNSIKHAFDEEPNGRITCGVSLEDDALHVDYRDNGCGVDVDALTSANGLGLRVAEAAMQSCGGTFEVVRSESGFKASAILPLREN
ncbi:histidine kinase dimerization/phosphoacceptor domain -containing protein [Histidinibacterium aquaticum]|uniref:histidine kinase n=1 Tax=Histidinibacterium aquaticum TaxID=2613962 RepID=A0A5J5GL56_9RHOB|nr:histidine kinase dimerization/phosphoacceptor domain -containing protein [Histidinibacterium aquaticum]KAA9008767.1 GAF domain-containing protein [Histidinibacterium aquaticum]